MSNNSNQNNPVKDITAIAVGVAKALNYAQDNMPHMKQNRGLHLTTDKKIVSKFVAMWTTLVAAGLSEFLTAATSTQNESGKEIRAEHAFKLAALFNDAREFFMMDAQINDPIPSDPIGEVKKVIELQTKIDGVLNKLEAEVNGNLN